MAESRDKPAPPMLMTLGQLAEHLQVDLSRIYELLRSEHLPYVKVGGEIAFDGGEIDKWMAGREAKP